MSSVPNLSWLVVAAVRLACTVALAFTVAD
jgi:hypothetical protein